MRWPAFIILLCTVGVEADIVYLRDGSRHYGELISETDGRIVFRVTLPGGTSTAVREFQPASVFRIERTGRRDVPPELKAAVTQAAAPSRDYEQMLREAFELLDDADYPAALRALQNAASTTEQDMLARLDEQCRAARGLPLAELLAATRVYVATRAGSGRGFQLTAVTPLERAALGDTLRRQVDTLLARRHGEYTVAEWTERIAEYKELQRGARTLVADAARAGALLRARLRHDPRLKNARHERTRLTQVANRLSDLAAQVRSIPGFTELDPDDGWVDPAEPPPRSRPATQPASQTTAEGEPP